MNAMRRPIAFLPIVMSLIALAVVLLHLARYGPAPQPDEGTSAHMWQLLMGLQIPLVLFFAATELPQSPRKAAPILAVQITAALLAVAPVILLHW